MAAIRMRAGDLKRCGIVPAPAPAHVYPPGTVVALFTVAGRPRPWSVPYVAGRRTVKPARMAAWQTLVAAAARRAMGARLPHAGHAHLILKFACRDTKNGKDVSADLTNLLKAAEDALQGVVIADDRRTVRISAEKVESNYDYLTVKVVAAARPGERL